MGVGEPMHNLENVLRALEILGHPDGLDLSSRRVTVSTVGVPMGIERLGAATRGSTALAISLHAADDATRERLVPGVRAPLAEIVEALRRYPLPPRRRFTIEYVLLKGINDSDAAARSLVRLLSKLRVKVNLLPLNGHDLTDLEPPTEERVASFQQVLLGKGVSAFIRRRRGADIDAACGQLLAVRPDRGGRSA
jgi:23S rRNA (adenine2503-C2)-methyltransferase